METEKWRRIRPLLLVIVILCGLGMAVAQRTGVVNISSRVDHWLFQILSMALFVILMDYGRHWTLSTAERSESAGLTSLDESDQITRDAVIGLRRQSKEIENPGVFVALAVGVFAILTNLPRGFISLLHAGPASHTRHLITTDPVILGLPFILTSLFLMSVVTQTIVSRRAGQYRMAYKAYTKAMEYKTGTALRAMNIFVMGVAVFAIGTALLSFDAYLRVTTGGVAVNSFLGIGEKLHDWDSVQRIEIIDSWPSPTHYYRYRLVFDDGSEWKSTDSSFGRTMCLVEPAMSYVSSQAKLPVTDSRTSRPPFSGTGNIGSNVRGE